ncbi:hypothetical protein Tco_0882511 [Tanacetum coccineum]
MSVAYSVQRQDLSVKVRSVIPWRIYDGAISARGARGSGHYDNGWYLSCFTMFRRWFRRLLECSRIVPLIEQRVWRDRCALTERQEEGEEQYLFAKTCIASSPHM